MLESIHSYLASILNSFSIVSFIDIVITSILIYHIISWIKGTQARQAVRGIVILLGAALASSLVGMVMLNYILTSLMTVGLVAVVVIFQPELRGVLNKLGSTMPLIAAIKDEKKTQYEKAVDEVSDALSELSTNSTGALIVIERDTKVGDIIESGVILDARINKNILLNLFYPGAPLHDEAVVISRDELRIKAAACVLPLTQNKNISVDIGTRHRAAIGMSENSDCVVFVASEETGTLSYAIDGRLSRFVDAMMINNVLQETFVPKDKKSRFMGIAKWLSGD
ncbi:MAG: diadenylate cyclase CdaA [Eubacteriaceae bacterium]|nr:diadenylate cyclase CdaA [Eubacteriaceae bacterium]